MTLNLFGDRTSTQPSARARLGLRSGFGTGTDGIDLNCSHDNRPILFYFISTMGLEGFIFGFVFILLELYPLLPP